MPVPKVSVIMPAYNAERFLAAAIESLRQQSLREFELIVVNDGSTDTTNVIAEDLAKKDPRITCISVANGGQAKARNIGVNLAKTELIGFLDADDIALPDRLRLQVDFMAKHPDISVLGGAMEEIDAQGKPTGFCYRPPLEDQDIRRELKSGCPFTQSTIMIRRAAFLASGGYRPQFCPSEDYDLWLRLASQVCFANLPETLIQYRVHGESVSRAKILYYALTTPAAQAAAQLREGGQPDPTEGVASLTPEVLGQLGFDSQDILKLQARAIISYASKMISRGATDAANDLLHQMETLNLSPTLHSEFAAEALIVKFRVRLRQHQWLLACVLVAKGLVSCPGLFVLIVGKAWRLLRRLVASSR